jgi:Leucine-rich repeat (LRR) protein
MAFETNVYYGYKASSNLSDVIDKEDALFKIGLNIGDLNIIRGVAGELGATRDDLVTLSNLTSPIYRTLDRFLSESSQYAGILSRAGGTDNSLQGNLEVNGPIGASAIRYNYVNTDTDQIAFADISTSRVSAWSSISPAGSSPSESDPIFYGSEVKIYDGGTVTTDKIQWGENAVPKLYTAEVPTHAITTTINGEQVKLYAMKSIPLKFSGFFRNFDSIVAVNPITGINISWRIVNQSNASDIQSYPNRGTTLNYRSVQSAPRTIEIYYPPDNFTSLTLTGVNLRTLPLAELPNLTQLNISFNDIRTVANLNIFSPNLLTLNIFGNNLYLAESDNLKKLNLDVLNHFPTSLASINMYGTFFGSIRWVNGSGIEVAPASVGAVSVFKYRFPSLITFNVGRGSGPFFNPDLYDPVCHLPQMPDTCQNYYVGNNDFRTVPATGLKDLPELRNIDLGGNRNLSDATFSIASTNIQTVNISSTNLPIPDLRSRTLLTSYGHTSNSNSSPFHVSTSSDVSYKFSGCTALTGISINASAVSGFIPKFKNNQSLTSFDAYAAQSITGGRPDNGEHGYADGTTYVLYKDTFNDAKDISFFRVLSNSLLVGKGFEPDTFKNLKNLSYLYWYSYGRTGDSLTDVPLPDISSCPALRYFIMPVNKFRGSIPTFTSNQSILYIDVSNNELSGGVPFFNNKLALNYFYAHNNALTSFNGFINTPNLYHVYLYNNQITGSIPALSEDSPNIDRLYLYNNQFTDYTSGSFKGLRRLTFLDVSTNNLSESNLNTIIEDLYENYILAPRSRVSVNLRSQSNAPGYNPSEIGTSREQEIFEKIAFLRQRGWQISW